MLEAIEKHVTPFFQQHGINLEEPKKEYYSLNAGLNISVEVINTIKEKPFNDVEIQMPSVYKKVKYRNKYEKIIIKRRKKSGCKPSSKPMLLSN